MRHRWPTGTAFAHKVLDPDDRSCPCCGRHMHVCDHRRHPFYTLDGPVELLCKLVHCPDKACVDHSHTHSPLAETSLVLPGWLIGWDVFCWIGHRRCARHWSVPQIRVELADSYHIPLSSDAIEVYIDRYQTMLAARHQDPAALANDYQQVEELILTIDGIQPEKGHETLYVVRELTAQRVWFAEALLCSSEAEVRRLLVQARQWAERLGKPVKLWISDKQDAFVKGIAGEFPEVPHRYCANHFLRDLAKPVLERDSHAKVKMRKKVRGLRAIERQVLDDRREEDVPPATGIPAAPTGSVPGIAADRAEGGVAAAGSDACAIPSESARRPVDEAGDVVLDYCSAVRGILNDDQGGPLHPPGLRMAEALGEVEESLQRNLEAKKGGERRISCGG
jgi:hypothetical protein